MLEFFRGGNLGVSEKAFPFEQQAISTDEIAERLEGHSAMEKEKMSRYSILWGLFAGVLTALLWVLSIPPFEFAEAAYIAFVPLLLWFYTRPNLLRSTLVIFGTSWGAWFIILIWLRHVTLLGTIGLAVILAGIFALWAFFVRWFLPKLANRPFGWRLVGFTGLAGAWVFWEWARSWIFFGFPWAPLSLSQWERPVVLQIAAWTGAYGVSFMLIFFNLCVAHTLWSRATLRKRKILTGWLSPDLYAGMVVLVSCIVVFFKTLPSPKNNEALFSAGVVQPYIPPGLKWDEEKEMENLKILEWHTLAVSGMQNDFILWPEAATPWPILGYERMQIRIEDLVRKVGKPVLMGNLAWFRETDEWYNGVFLVDPEHGLTENFYAKRQLVPFGEYVPEPFEFIEKIVPIGGQFVPGEEAGLIHLNVNGRNLKIGPLVCYEDVFPALARESVKVGAEVLYVATNNAWYGEEGGAAQHAAHSVLRAVENRRPVIRCGNGGWSGWIDAYGMIREVIVDENESVYFRGGGTCSVSHYREWMRRKSCYTLYGEWFVMVCGGLAVIAALSFGYGEGKEGHV